MRNAQRLGKPPEGYTHAVGFVELPTTACIVSLFDKYKDIIHHGGDTRYLICVKKIRLSWREMFSVNYQVTIYKTDQKTLDEVLRFAMDATKDGQKCYLGKLTTGFLQMEDFWMKFLEFMNEKITKNPTTPLRVLTRAFVEMITAQKPEKRLLFWK